MQDRPTAAEAVEAVASFLKQDLMGELEGSAAFQVRIASNLLSIVERELRLGPELGQRERARLAELLGHDGELTELNRELAAAIRCGQLDAHSDALIAHLRATARERLEIANPRYLDQSTK